MLIERNFDNSLDAWEYYDAGPANRSKPQFDGLVYVVVERLSDDSDDVGTALALSDLLE